MILILVLYALLASTFTIGKMALAYSPPILLIGIRMVLAGVLLLGYQYLFNRKHFKLERQDIWSFIHITLFHVYITYIAEFWALDRMTSTKAALFFNLAPFITALFSYLMFKEKMTILKWVGLLIGFFGMLPVLMEGTPGEVGFGALREFSYAELAILTSVISACYGWITMKHLVKDRGYSTIMVNGAGMLAGGVLAFATAPIFEREATSGFITEVLPNWQQISVFSWYVILLVVISSVIFYNLYSHLLRSYSATWLSFAGFVTPLFTAGFSAILIPEESVSMGFFVSLVLVAIGLFIFYKEELRQGYIST